MCSCLAKCLLGVLFSWAIYIINILAAGALLAGAFAYWLAYSVNTGNAYITAYGYAGTLGSDSFLGPLSDISKALLSSKLSGVTWTETSLNAAYLGIAAQVLAAATILVYVLFSTCFCLCSCLSMCCKSSRFNFFFSLAKLGVALIGVISLGSSMAALDTSLKALTLPDIPTSSTSLKTFFFLMVLNPSSGVGVGKSLGSLGCALLGVNCVLHFLTLLQCGGSHHHPTSQSDTNTAAKGFRR